MASYPVSQSEQLLSRFNDRDRDAMGEVYQMYYRELHSFADKVFHDTGILSSDLIHDIFVAIFRSSTKNLCNASGCGFWLNFFSTACSDNTVTARFFLWTSIPA